MQATLKQEEVLRTDHNQLNNFSSNRKHSKYRIKSFYQIGRAIKTSSFIFEQDLFYGFFLT